MQPQQNQPKSRTVYVVVNSKHDFDLHTRQRDKAHNRFVMVAHPNSLQGEQATPNTCVIEYAQGCTKNPHFMDIMQAARTKGFFTP